MQDMRNADAADTTTVGEWFDRIEEIGEELGYFQRLGQKHSAYFVDETPTLLVTFETVEQIRASGEGQMPYGHTIAKAHGWSHLCIIADGETWYRDPAVYRYFDRLTDDAFFEDFDHVVFYGVGMGGYAAAAFSVTAPGATVLLAEPVATLDPAITGWDERYRAHRRLNFGDRYGYAPDMVEGAGDVYVLYDPTQTNDAMHAALFTKPFVTKLPCANMGARVDGVLAYLDILPKVIELAGEGRFTAQDFWRLYRARRDYSPYLRNVLNVLLTNRRTMLAALLCRNVTTRKPAPRFDRRLAELEAKLHSTGRRLPAPRTLVEKT